jgi:hypothetical protein
MVKGERFIGAEGSQERVPDWSPELHRVEQTGLCADYYNAWAGVGFDVGEGKLGPFMGTLPRYEEYLRQNMGPHDPAIAEKIIKDSDPEKVKEIDDLVDEFNTDLARMIKEQDLKTAGKFFKRADKLIRGIQN